MQTTYTRDDYPFYGLKPVSRLSDLDRARQDARLVNEYLRQVAGPYVLPYRISTDVVPNAAFATRQSDNGDASNRRSSVDCSAFGSQAAFSASLKAQLSDGGMVASDTPELDNVLRFLHDDNQIFARGFSNMTKKGRISTHNPRELSNEQQLSQRIHFMALPNTLCEVVAPSDCFVDSESAQEDDEIVFGFVEVVLRDTDILARWANVLDDDQGEAEAEEGRHYSAGRARRDTVSTVASTIWSDADAEEVYATPATSACASPVDEPKEL